MQGAQVKSALIPLDTLREQIAQAIATAKAYDVPSVCVRLEIQQTVADGDEQEAFGNKRMYVRRRILLWDEADLIALAARVLREYASVDLENTVSEMTVHTEHRVSALVRCDVLKALNPLEPLFGEIPLIDCLSEVFGTSVMPNCKRSAIRSTQKSNCSGGCAKLYSVPVRRVSLRCFRATTSATAAC